MKFSISWVCYRSSRVEKQAFNEVYVNLVVFILSRTDLGVLIKQQMRRRKELVKFFSTTVIFYLPPTIPNKKSLFLLPVSLHNKSF